MWGGRGSPYLTRLISILSLSQFWKNKQTNKQAENGHNFIWMYVIMKKRMARWEKEIFPPFIEANGNLDHNYLLPLLVIGWAPPWILPGELFEELWNHRSLQRNKDMMDHGGRSETNLSACVPSLTGSDMSAPSGAPQGHTVPFCFFAICSHLFPFSLLPSVLPTVPPPHSSVSQLCITLIFWASLLISCFQVLGGVLFVWFSGMMYLFSPITLSSFLILEWTQAVGFIPMRTVSPWFPVSPHQH